MCMCALQGQQAHSPGQSAAAPREQYTNKMSPWKGKSANYQLYM